MLNYAFLQLITLLLHSFFQMFDMCILWDNLKHIFANILPVKCEHFIAVDVTFGLTEMGNKIENSTNLFTVYI